MTTPTTFRSRAAALAVPVLACAIAAILYLADANPAASQAPQLLARQASHNPGLDPASPAWDNVPAMRVPLSAQLASYATGGGSIPSLSAQALHYKGTLFVRVTWQDVTRDDSTLRVEQFSDAVALEFPAQAATTVPSICMGQADAGVNVWHWRADSQVGHDDPAVRYPNLWVEDYPSDDPEFYPARAVGNPYAAAEGGAVQNLISRAFGNIRPSATQDVQGHGVHDGGAWTVVFARPLVQADTSLVTFRETAVTDMAFAVWNGSEGDRNGQKSVSGFVTLAIMPGEEGSQVTTWLIAAGVLAALTAVGIGIAAYGYRRKD